MQFRLVNEAEEAYDARQNPRQGRYFIPPTPALSHDTETLVADTGRRR